MSIGGFSCFPGRSTMRPRTSWIFDGIDDGIGFGNNHSFEHTDSFSVSVFANIPSFSVQRAIFSKLQSSPGFRGWEFGITTQGRLFLLFISNFVGGNLFNIQTLDNSVPLNTLTQLGVSYAGTSLATGVNHYINGAFASTSSTTAPGPITGTTIGTANLQIGQRPPGNTTPLAGHALHFAIWNSALTATHFSEVYNGGVPPDLNSLPTAPPPLFWVKLNNETDIPTVIVDHGTGSLTGAAFGGLVPEPPP